MKIKIYEPELTDADRQTMVEAIESGWVSSLGPFVGKFEQKFAKYTGIKYCSSCSNGTVALHLALLALGIKSGDRVGVPSFTYVASVNAISYVNATPVIFDVCAKTWNIDIDCLTDEELDSLDCLVTVDIYGLPSITEQQYKRLKSHGVSVVNDCAESLGSRIDGVHVGAYCDISTFSFFGNKTITTGEGGMVASNDCNIIEKVEILKNQGRTDEPYFHHVVGYNYRLTNVQSALGFSQLSRIDDTLARKKQIYEKYIEGFTHLSITGQEISDDKSTSCWLCAFTFESNQIMHLVKNHLYQNSIDSRPFFTPVEKFEMYKTHQTCNNSHFLYSRGICLPSHPKLTDQEIDMVITKVSEIVA